MRKRWRLATALSETQPGDEKRADQVHQRIAQPAEHENLSRFHEKHLSIHEDKRYLSSWLEAIARTCMEHIMIFSRYTFGIPRNSPSLFSYTQPHAYFCTFRPSYLLIYNPISGIEWSSGDNHDAAPALRDHSQDQDASQCTQHETCQVQRHLPRGGVSCILASGAWLMSFVGFPIGDMNWYVSTRGWRDEASRLLGKIPTYVPSYFFSIP